MEAEDIKVRVAECTEDCERKDQVIEWPLQQVSLWARHPGMPKSSGYGSITPWTWKQMVEIDGIQVGPKSVSENFFITLNIYSWKACVNHRDERRWTFSPTDNAKDIQAAVVISSIHMEKAWPTLI